MSRRWDVLVIIVLFPLLSFSFLACSLSADNRNSRIQCAKNLQKIGQAILVYANENKAQYPRTTYAKGPTVKPVWGTGANAANPFGAGGPQPNDVTAALFLLLRTPPVTPPTFVCPATSATNWDFGGGGKTANSWSNWEGKAGIKQHLSYSYVNPYPDDAAIGTGYKVNTTLPFEFAIVADMNPGVANGSNVLTVTSAAPKSGNSRNHSQEGQNVLYADGHVEFKQTPFCGPNGDNIYSRSAAGGSAPTAVAASPADVNDCVLLPCEE